MSKVLLIDYKNQEETRTALLNGNRLEDFQVETVSKKEIKGNIYLAKVVRVEPSLQVAFVEYGADRHGFLPFSEIHPDYYQLPKQDRERLVKSLKDIASANSDKDDDMDESASESTLPDNKKRNVVENLDDNDDIVEASFENFRKKLLKTYKIQDVIKPRQVLLIQVVKEERGDKGAAVTTYLSLAGLYCVLMPNSGKSIKFGVSRKINYRPERRRIKEILQSLKIKDGETLIVRTAGKDKTKKDLKKDFEYLSSIWNDIKEKTVKSEVPSLVYEDGDLIKHVLRDSFKSDIEKIIVDGKEGFELVKEIAGNMGISKRVVRLHTEKKPLFMEYGVESQYDMMHSPNVKLSSGAYLVINQTEALVAIDVNSGKAIRERDIDDTALKTNIEAAREIAIQLKLRDMSGLVVIDFIDMVNPDDNYKLEAEMRKALRTDKARIQMGRVNNFGLMILSRQRIKPSVVEANYRQCAHCFGTGLQPALQTSAVMLIRRIEEELLRKTCARMIISVPTEVALYMLNQKRLDVRDLEEKYKTSIIILADNTVLNEREYKFEKFSSNASGEKFYREKQFFGLFKKYDRKVEESRRIVRNTKQNNRTSGKKKSGFFKLG